MKHHLKLLAATAPPKVTATFTMKVTRDFCSTMGNMHGGAIALVLDMCTTACMAPVSTPDFWLFGGVSRTLNTTFLRAIRKGTEIEVFCEVLHVGARLGRDVLVPCFDFYIVVPGKGKVKLLTVWVAAIRGEIRDCADGKLFVVGEHNKASISFEKKL